MKALIKSGLSRALPTLAILVALALLSTPKGFAAALSGDGWTPKAIAQLTSAR